MKSGVGNRLSPDYTHLFKVVLIGESGVGKSNLLLRYVEGKFDIESRSTIGVEFFSKTVKVGESVVKLQLWDTAGQERYRAVTTAYYRGAAGAFLVYDVSNAESFSRLEAWVEEIKANCSPLPLLFLVGNKTDLEKKRAVSSAAGLRAAEKFGMLFFETSALEGTRVEEIFQQMVSLMLERSPPLLSREASPPCPASEVVPLEDLRVEPKVEKCSC